MEESTVDAIRDVLERGLEGGLRAAVHEALKLCGARREGVRDVRELPDETEGCFSMCVAAGVRGGKSFLIRALASSLLARGRVVQVYVYTGNVAGAADSFDGLWADGVNLICEFSDEELAKFVAKRSKASPPALVIFDDVLGQGLEKSKVAETLFSAFRHSNVSVIVATQKANCALTPTAKQNADFILFGRLNPRQMKTLHGEMDFADEALEKPAAFSQWVKTNLAVERHTFGVWVRDSMRVWAVRA